MDIVALKRITGTRCRKTAFIGAYPS